MSPVTVNTIMFLLIKIFSFIIFIIFLFLGKSLQCYNCTSSYAYNMTRPNPSCEKIDGTKYLVNCKSGEVCGKYEARNSSKYNQEVY